MKKFNKQLIKMMKNVNSKMSLKFCKKMNMKMIIYNRIKKKLMN